MSSDYNPWAEDQTESVQDTPTFAEIMKIVTEGALLELHTWLPVIVTKVYPTGHVDLQPTLQAAYRDGAVVTLPIIQRVPIEQPRGANYWVKLPVAVGDLGRAVFCERSLDSWRVKGGIVDPADPRHHDMSDAIFIPGTYPDSEVLPGSANDDLVVHNGDAEISVQKTGRFKVKNESEELFNLLDELLTVLSAALMVTDIGPQPFMPETIEAIEEIQTRLETLKGV